MANPHQHSSFRQRPPHMQLLQQSRPANNDQFWAYDEVAAIFFEVVAEYAKRHTDFMTHEKMVAAFMEHAEGKQFSTGLMTRGRDHIDSGRAGVVGRAYTEGRSEWENRLERKKIGSAWAYRVRKS